MVRIFLLIGPSLCTHTSPPPPPLSLSLSLAVSLWAGGDMQYQHAWQQSPPSPGRQSPVPPPPHHHLPRHLSELLLHRGHIRQQERARLSHWHSERYKQCRVQYMIRRADITKVFWSFKLNQNFKHLVPRVGTFEDIMKGLKIPFLFSLSHVVLL